MKQKIKRNSKNNSKNNVDPFQYTNIITVIQNIKENSPCQFDDKFLINSNKKQDEI